MDDPIRRAFTRRPVNKNSQVNETLVYGVKFGIGMAACLSAMEIANMAFLHTWNSDVFNAISTLTGLVIGIFVGHRA